MVATVSAATVLFVPDPLEFVSSVRFAPRRFASRSRPCIVGRRPNGHSDGIDRVAGAVFNRICNSNFRIGGERTVDNFTEK